MPITELIENHLEVVVRRGDSGLIRPGLRDREVAEPIHPRWAHAIDAVWIPEVDVQELVVAISIGLQPPENGLSHL